MKTCTPGTLVASERTLARLWVLSGAPNLVGYEAMLLATLARADLALYEQLTGIDDADADAVVDAVEAIQEWRQAVVAGTRSFTFGPRPPKTADMRTWSAEPGRDVCERPLCVTVSVQGAEA